ncbi:MAG: ferredoxin family protein [Zhongshania sp.]|uniref:4Fe-4S dicluster domain-containing protein n=1 Tax=Zhongshania sp. TaxID=1971902 RepID=UPI0026112D50|nr:ferredoxin family protein [Zhongshania sp.]MDF1690790.1 ferredoxin family protein [Zhongshania sp.]
MSYVITAPCVADYSCVEVCPVDCISPMPDDSGFDAATQLYINPVLCVDCDACREACPVNAIFAEDQLPEKWLDYIGINAAHFQSHTQTVAEVRHDK